MFCRHREYVDLYPDHESCRIHRKRMDKEQSYPISTVQIRICKNCGKILKVTDYGE